MVLFTKLKEIMSLYLSKYPTTLDYDIEYFNNNRHNMECNEYNCYVIRIGEKKILNFYLNMANDILKLLNTDKDEIKKLFHELIVTCGDNGNNIINSGRQNFINNLLKYKNYLSFILPLLLMN